MSEDHASDPSLQPMPAQPARVEAMAGYGISEADIAKVLEIDPATLRRLYAKELDSGTIKANSKVAESLYRKALGDGAQSVTAAIFWLKTRARWKETSVLEHGGPYGGPVPLQIITGVPRDDDSYPVSRRETEP